MEQLRDKIVVVSGAVSGIGRQIAQAYIDEGAIVILADLDLNGGERLEEELLAGGAKVKFIYTDIAKSTSIEALFELIETIYKRVDILINNAGICEWKSPFELTIESWDRIINTNLRSVFLCSRLAAQLMSKGGAVVSIASTRAFMSEPNSEAYAASKGGVIALTHALAASLAPQKIQVNCISPGWIQVEDYDKLRNVDHEQHFSGRVGTPDDIARACIFLTNPANNFISGQNLIIDGGMTKKMIYVE